MKRRRTLISALMLLVFISGCGGAGDRVLVSKCYYDGLPWDPKRHDVVVFRFPAQPVKGGTPTNYIKRLLGLAGETIAVFMGQLFYTTELSYDDDMTDLAKATGDDDWSRKMMKHVRRNDENALKFFKKGEFKIVRKRPATMLAMRRIVYDNDYQALDLRKKDLNFPHRWSPNSGSSWKSADDSFKVFSHKGEGQSVDWLHYQHILRPFDWPNPGDPDFQPRMEQIKKPQLITDFSGYNSYESPSHPSHPPQSWVGDLMLDVELNIEKSQGEFYLELARGVDRFQARFNLQDGTCTLVRLQDGAKQKEEVLGAEKTSVIGPGTYSLRFANFDQRLTLWVGRSLPFGPGVNYEQAWRFNKNDQQFVNIGPTKNDLKPVSVGSKGAAVSVAHLKIWRDTFYTVPDVTPHRDMEFWQDPDKWGALHNMRLDEMLMTLYVQKNHYLCMGDNSPESYDGRNWGLVPKRLLLGRALMVYWPETRIGTIIH